MKKAKNFFKGLLMSVIALTVAFAALSIPFGLLSSMSGVQLRTLFLTEIAVYFFSGMFFLIFKEKKQQRKAEEKEKRLARRAKFEQAQREYYDLAA